MTARELLVTLRRRGVGIAMDEQGRIVLRGQAVADLSDDERNLIVATKAALLPILAAERAAGWRPWWPPAPEHPCPTCGGTRFALSAALSGWCCIRCEPISTAPVAWCDAIAEEVAPAG